MCSSEFRFRASSQNGANLLKTQTGRTGNYATERTVWGDKFGMLTDKFGIKWMFNCPKKESA